MIHLKMEMTEGSLAWMGVLASGCIGSQRGMRKFVLKIPNP
jgi:hypothetical protein